MPVPVLAVELDDEPRPLPVSIHHVPVDEDIADRLWNIGPVAAEVGEPILELATRVGRVRGLLDKGHERLDASSRGVGDELDDLVHVEEPLPLSALPGTPSG